MLWFIRLPTKLEPAGTGQALDATCFFASSYLYDGSKVRGVDEKKDNKQIKGTGIAWHVVLGSVAP